MWAFFGSFTSKHVNKVLSGTFDIQSCSFQFVSIILQPSQFVAVAVSSAYIGFYMLLAL